MLRALIEAVLAGVHRDDVVSARAAAKALVAFLDGMPTCADNVVKLAERRAVYGSHRVAGCPRAPRAVGAVLSTGLTDAKDAPLFGS